MVGMRWFLAASALWCGISVAEADAQTPAQYYPGPGQPAATGGGACSAAQSATLGCVLATSVLAHNFVNGINSSTGALTDAQPAVGDISGLGSGVATALADATNGTGGLVTYGGSFGNATGHASLDLALTGGTLTGATTVSGASFGLSGSFSAADWGTAGVRYANVASTITDTTSTGTVAAAYTDVFGGNTIAASSATTFTKYYAAYFKAPVAGSGVTFTNNYALGADSLAVNGLTTLTGAPNTNTLAIVGSLSGSGTTSPGISETVSGSTSGIVPGILFFGNETSGTAGAGSSLLALQVAGTNEFSVLTNGYLNFASGAEFQAAGTNFLDYNVTTGTRITAHAVLQLAGTDLYFTTNGGIQMNSTSNVVFGINASSGNPSITLNGATGSGLVPNSLLFGYGPASGTIDSTAGLFVKETTGGTTTTVFSLDNNGNGNFANGVAVGSPTGGASANNVNVAGVYKVANVSGATETCTMSALGATITIAGGIITATTGC